MRLQWVRQVLHCDVLPSPLQSCCPAQQSPLGDPRFCRIGLCSQRVQYSLNHSLTPSDILSCTAPGKWTCILCSTNFANRNLACWTSPIWSTVSYDAFNCLCLCIPCILYLVYMNANTVPRSGSVSLRTLQLKTSRSKIIIFPLSAYCRKIGHRSCSPCKVSEMLYWMWTQPRFLEDLSRLRAIWSSPCHQAPECSLLKFVQPSTFAICQGILPLSHIVWPFSYHWKVVEHSRFWKRIELLIES